MSYEYDLYNKADHTARIEDAFLTRREWLQKTGTGFGALALSAMMAEQGLMAQSKGLSPLAPKQPPRTPKAKRVLNIFLAGGAPHQDLWDPNPELNSNGGKAKGNRKLLASPFKFPKYGKSGLQMSEIWPNLGRHADDIAIVRSTYTDAPAHGAATLIQNTGTFTEVRPSVGSWVLYGLGTENQNLPGFITMRPGGAPDARTFNNSFLPGAYQGTFVDSNNTKIEDIIKNIKSDFASRKDQRKQLDLLLKLNEIHKQKRQAEGELEARINTFELAYRMQTDAREAFDIAGEKPETVAKYGTNSQGRQMLIARRLLERGVRFVQVSQGGWDLHGGIAQRAKRNADQLDPGIGALIDDLKEKGMFEDTLIYITSEFGRTSTEDGGGGRSHNARGFSTVFVGGGVKGGFSYGATDEIGSAAVKDKVHVKDIHATILNQLGFDHEQLTFATGGRDFRLTQPTRTLPQGGMPVKGILA
jgi:hypothetical protein